MFLHLATGGVLSRVIVTVSLDSGQEPFVIVHLKTFGPTPSPVTCESREFGETIVPAPLSGGLPTRTAAAMRLAATEAPAGAIWVVGNAPTALQALLEHPPQHPALIVGLPVGFVGAAEAKAALAHSSLPHVTNQGERGGSAVAVAAVNALLYFEDEDDA
jgi:hypothetical protein